MRDKTVKDAMTPLESVYMLNINAIIDRDTMKDVSIVFHTSLGLCSKSDDSIMSSGFVYTRTLHIQSYVYIFRFSIVVTLVCQYTTTTRTMCVGFSS